MVLSQMQEGKVRIEISSPVENVVAEQRTAAKDTTRPQLPSRLITCSQTMLGDQELFPPIVRLQDLEQKNIHIRVAEAEAEGCAASLCSAGALHAESLHQQYGTYKKTKDQNLGFWPLARPKVAKRSCDQVGR